MPTVPRPRSVPPVPTPTAWAGGRNILVPGIGVGVIVADAGPRVIRIDLPAPSCAVFGVDSPDGPRWTVLVDPRVDGEHRDRVVACVALLEREGVSPLDVDVPTTEPLPPLAELDGAELDLDRELEELLEPPAPRLAVRHRLAAPAIVATVAASEIVLDVLSAFPA